MAKDLQRLLNRKDDSPYGLSLVSPADASRMVGWGKRLLGHARRAVEAQAGALAAVSGRASSVR